MDDLPDVFARDFGLRPQGKSAPMAASRTAAAGLGEGSSSVASSLNNSRSGWNPPSTSDPFLGDRGAGISDDYVFVGVSDLSNSSSRAKSGSPSSLASFDALFGDVADSGTKASSPLPVYDKPVYDDDIFHGVPGVKSSSSVKYDDVFASVLSKSSHGSSPLYEDLLESLGKQTTESRGRNDSRPGEQEQQDMSPFDELIPGFGGSSQPKKREVQEEPDLSSSKRVTNKAADPFVVLESVSTSPDMPAGLFFDPLENISRPINSGSTHSTSKSTFDDDNAFDGTSKSIPSSAVEMDERHKDKSFFDDFQSKNPNHCDSEMEPPQQFSTDAFENIMPHVQNKKFTNLQDPVGISDRHNMDTYIRNDMGDQSPNTYEHIETRDDIWLTVLEIPLHTQPTSAPSPSRPPPPLVIKPTHSDVGAKRNNSVSFQQSTQSNPYNINSMKRSRLDELEDFAIGKSQSYAQHHDDLFNSKEEYEKKITAEADMKDTMDRVEETFKQATEVRERDHDSKFSRNNEYIQQERNEKENLNSSDQEDQERLDQEQMQKEREEKEELKRLEKQREVEVARERDKGRQAAERAMREARERAAAEARQKAERAAAEARQRAERAAVQRVAAEARERAAVMARERAEKAAAETREKAAAEARERAAAEARERAEKAAAEARDAAEAREKAAAARERAAAEAREKAANEARDRAAVERAAAEARLRAQRAAVERAAAEARERAAAAAREKAAAAARYEQQEEENDLESFFGMSTRANSAPKQRSTSSETMFAAKDQNKGGSDGPWRTSSASSSTIRKASSTTNIVDDLSSIFGAPPSSGEFQEIEGESDERRKARLERLQRTQERAAKALAEKNERDMQIQQEQAERHRISETLDFEIRRWAAGKEGNLRALLSTLQYVLWPECGWQPVSLTDLITAAAVKKVYRKATLCIHPDKVQQKGATLQQKYIAEKVFDLLKEAWNKFNSEELF